MSSPTIYRSICFSVFLLYLQLWQSHSVSATALKGHKREIVSSTNQQVNKLIAGGGTVLQASPNTIQSYQGNRSAALEQDGQTQPLSATPKPDTNMDEQTCHKSMDIVIVLDASHSSTPVGWAVIKKAAADLVDLLDISKDGTHVAIIKYSTIVSTFYMFDSNPSKQKTQEQIKALGFDDQWSRLDLALVDLSDHVFSPVAGGRPDVPKAVVVFTDGRVSGPRKPDRVIDWNKIIAGPLDTLRLQNVILFSVAVGNNPDYTTLDLIAGDRARVFLLNETKLLSESLGRVSKNICPTTSSTTTPSSTISASASASVNQQASSICTTVTTTTCAPKPSCSPSAKPPCLNLFLVQVCNTYISTTSCKSPKTVYPSLINPVPSMPVKPTTEPVVPPCPQPGPYPGCIAPSVSAPVPLASQPVPQSKSIFQSSGAMVSNNNPWQTVARPQANTPPQLNSPQQAYNLPQPNSPVPVANTSPLANAPQETDCNTQSQGNSPSQTNNPPEATNPRCIQFGCPTPPEKRCD